MGQVSIKAGILRRDHAYFGDRTSIPSEIFLSENVVSFRPGWLEPAGDSGLGAPSQTMNFVQGSPHAVGAKLGVDFYYYVNNSTKVRYFITCDSITFTNALESTDAHNFVDLAVATGSGYVKQA